MNAAVRDPDATPLFRRIVTTVKRIAGMPNYEAYVAHLHGSHPDCAVPTEKEYYELYLKQRYEGGATRCC